ncbi:hypothetical protein FXV77_11370 [Sphingobacterium phlebotomi]|uniref:Neutral/alkaline non-lysosomal ceramidase N-terminal domain-containing protein n=1 Tax=Sphingobacterium phlebotomi TaxID=2605433 RepID=A0A5D4H4Q3_9SPHI|nr:neutral/alkaline non-lysosomal ceramidase N-terminal domain-containing protein [Sphingobacterium phlebotomi]TYR36031.1 hypothetical protein FXV77_11370 [Sphingobacterium phlebotomi]
MIAKKDSLRDVYAGLGARFGLGTRNITPPLGIYARNWGAAKFDQATGIHQELLMQCLYTESADGQAAVFLTADLGWWKNANDEKRIRQALLARFNLEETDLILALSHTHAGPSICSTDEDQPGGAFIAPYLDFLKDQAIACIEEAKSAIFDGRLTWGYGVCDLACNRDLQVGGDYLIGFNPIEKPDHTLLVGQLRDTSNILRGVICNYACHPTSFAHENELLSPDFVGELRVTVERALHVPCLFLQGASGDLAPKKQYVKESKLVEANGRQLGYAVLSTLAQMGNGEQNWVYETALVSGAPLACWKFKDEQTPVDFKKVVVQVQVPYKKLDSAASILAEYQQCKDRVLKDRLWRKYNTRKTIGDQKVAEIPVWIWKMGNAIVVAQANEAYSVYQMQIRKAFPNHCIAFINIANGYVGYLAPKELYEKDIYAVWQSPYDKGSLEILIKETEKAIIKLLTYETRMD